MPTNTSVVRTDDVAGKFVRLDVNNTCGSSHGILTLNESQQLVEILLESGFLWPRSRILIKDPKINSNNKLLKQVDHRK